MKTKELWVTNINYKKDIKIDDLGLTVPAGKSHNLLARNCRFTVDQIMKSISSGSIFKKSKWLRIRKVGPNVELLPEQVLKVTDRTASPIRYSLSRSVVEITEKTFEDLDYMDYKEDEKFSDDMSEVAFMDSAPLLPVDKTFKE